MPRRTYPRPTERFSRKSATSRGDVATCRGAAFGKVEMTHARYNLHQVIGSPALSRAPLGRQATDGSHTATSEAKKSQSGRNSFNIWAKRMIRVAEQPLGVVTID